jgi:Uma2 family endonuclease
MSLPVREPYLTAEEYLAIERHADTRSELINGRMYEMAGASREHNLIAGNVFAGLHQRLTATPCETYKSDMRVKVGPTGLYTYPDVVVACGKLEFEDAELDTLLNPQVVIEVLSESTEKYDRGAKFEHYQRISSLQEYVLVAQDRVRIDHFLRHGEQWLLTSYSDMDEGLRFPTLDCAIPLGEVYARVEFPAPERAPEAERAVK